MRKRAFASGLAGVVLAAIAGSAKADTLWTLPQSYPDISAANIVVSYDNGVFTARGNALSLDTFVDFVDVTDGGSGFGSFLLTALIDSTGTMSSAELTITGDVGSGVETLFHSDSATRFGSGPTKAFQFVFSNNNGAIGTGSDIGVKLFANYSANDIDEDPDFGHSFASNGDSQADAFVIPATPVPTPAAAVGGLGLLSVFGLKRAAGRFRRQG